jgi:hypothetical protein
MINKMLKGSASDSSPKGVEKSAPTKRLTKAEARRKIRRVFNELAAKHEMKMLAKGYNHYELK